jgi:hypothetical protein
VQSSPSHPTAVVWEAMVESAAVRAGGVKTAYVHSCAHALLQAPLLPASAAVYACLTPIRRTVLTTAAADACRVFACLFDMVEEAGGTRRRLQHISTTRQLYSFNHLARGQLGRVSSNACVVCRVCPSQWGLT